MARAFPELLAISDRRSLEVGFEAWLERLRADGVEALMLREKDLGDGALLALARRARRALPPPAIVLVNGRLDVALAAGCDGVHLPASGLPVAALRAGLGRAALIGCSTHTADEIVAAARAGADYAVFGPVYPTPSKARYGPPTGLAGLRRAVAAARSVAGRAPMPVVALGGVTAERLAEVIAAGAAGVAGIRLFQDDAERRRAVAEAARLRSPVDG